MLTHVGGTENDPFDDAGVWPRRGMLVSSVRRAHVACSRLGELAMRIRFWAGLLRTGVAAALLLTLGTQVVNAGARHVPASNGASAAGEHMWFVRPDGGDRKQCTGRVDAAYRGHGSNQPCAFKHPQNLFSNDEYNNKQWVVAGGDTVVIRGGPYRMGYQGPEGKDAPGMCPGDPYGCTMPPVPAGTRERPTRLLGEHFGSCGGGAPKTQLFGGYALGLVLNLSDAQYVDVECLELTDHGQCTRAPGVPASDTCSTSYPLSDFAGAGIGTNQRTANVLLKNLDIHGFQSRGIIGAIGGDVYAENVRIAFNGQAGWDFDVKGTKSAATAFVHAKNLTVEWNGCNEEYPITHAVPAHTCFDQDNGGYGDGIGTPDTPLNFTCEHCTFRYNTQDGFDLLHVGGSVISVKQSISYGNMGQQWKMGAMQHVVFRNNVTVHNCSRLSAPMEGAPADYNRHLSLFCRAAGDGIAFAVVDGGSYVFQNNSYVGYGSTSYDISCGAEHCSAANIVFENNLHAGYKNPKDGQFPAVFYGQNLPRNPFQTQDHNIFYRMRSCPPGTADRCVDPKVVNLPVWSGEASLDHVDLHLTAGSPARGAGVAVPEMETDFDGVARPSGVAPDIGAFQFHP